MTQFLALTENFYNNLFFQQEILYIYSIHYKFIIISFCKSCIHSIGFCSVFSAYIHVSSLFLSYISIKASNTSVLYMNTTLSQASHFKFLHHQLAINTPTNDHLHRINSDGSSRRATTTSKTRSRALSPFNLYILLQRKDKGLLFCNRKKIPVQCSYATECLFVCSSGH